jgi:hypothetical protein
MLRGHDEVVEIGGVEGMISSGTTVKGGEERVERTKPSPKTVADASPANETST